LPPDFKAKMQFHFGWGSAHSASQTPYTDLRDLTSKGSGERGMEKGNGRGKKEGRAGREWEVE